MIPWKKINLALMAAICLLAALTLKKLLSQSASPILESVSAPDNDSSESLLINEPQEKSFLDHDRLAREVDVLTEHELTTEALDRRYEELKYDRIVEALRTHQTGELKTIFLDHVNYELLPTGSHERLKKIAEEEGLGEFFDQLHR